MSKRLYISVLAVIAAAAILLPETGARKVRQRLPAGKPAAEKVEMTKGSQAISTDCKECGDGYTLADVVFSGYDKKASADKESFFVSNKSDRTLTGISLYMVYLTTDSMQLHKRWVSVRCHIPAGETAKVDVKTWDTQKSFYYYLSDAPRRSRATPYMVRFDPVTIYLRYK